MRTSRAYLTGLLAALLTLGSCAEKKPPARNHIPLLKARLFSLQEAVKTLNRAAIDSLLSVQILDNDQNSDSLLQFAYGPDGGYVFRQFAVGEITYTNDNARIDCFIMDSSHTRDRPLILTYVYEHDQWLLKRFEPGKVETERDTSDSI
ncbi:MAG: hypothetical protein KAW46_00735 [candidate division Zixibacteria bacterium]|nr:hypothetical protein [candidate division Zixibacteria bacterium]